MLEQQNHKGSSLLCFFFVRMTLIASYKFSLKIYTIVTFNQFGLSSQDFFGPIEEFWFRDL